MPAVHPSVTPAEADPSVVPAPMIQICEHQATPPDVTSNTQGYANEAYVKTEVEEEVSTSSISCPVSQASSTQPLDELDENLDDSKEMNQPDGDKPKNSYSRRFSHQGVSKLVVPVKNVGLHRRRSLGSSLSEEVQSVFTFDKSDLDLLDPSKALNHQRLSVSSPRSPGGRSMRSDWSELAKLERTDSIGSFHSMESLNEISQFSDSNATCNVSGVSSQMSARIKDLVRKFNSRTERFKERATQPLSPTSSIDGRSVFSGVSGAELEPPARQIRLDSFIPLSSRASGVESIMTEVFVGTGRCRIKMPAFFNKFRLPDTIESTRKFYISWLFLLTMAFMYNAIAIPLRVSFTTARFYHPIITYENRTEMVCDSYNTTTAPANCENVTSVVAVETYTYYKGYQTPDNLMYWWILDYLCDLLYLLDIILIKGRIRFIKNGLLEKDRKETQKHYTSKIDFKLDIMSLTPLDLLYFIPSLKYSSWVRLPRLLKMKTFWEFYDRLDRMVSSAHIIRVIRTLTYMMYLIHIEACGYYAMSAYEGLRRNEWVYSGEGTAYIRCMYLATKTATSIGSNPRPGNIQEYLFMTVYWLSGVFVFAMLIGQIRDIFQSAGMAKEQYRKTMDSTLFYMKSLNLPKDLQDRVRTWFNYNWKTSKTLDENSLVEGLPKKMKADLAIHVHFNTLSKVHLFQDCDKNMLFDLVLKLKPSLYLKGDYICRKGEVGTEMYIVMAGQVEVVGGEDNSVVFATLYEGSAFGEISLLALTGGNRRTADVRSKGFSQLFILSKNDFEEAMRDYPAAAKLLKRRAKKLLSQNAKHTRDANKDVEEVIKERAETPKLIRTVVQAIDAESKIHGYLGSPKSLGSQLSVKSGRLSRQSRVSQIMSSVAGETPDIRELDDLCQTQENEVNLLRNGLVEPDPDILEDDELLIIEEIERRLTPEELDMIHKENNIDLLPMSPTHDIDVLTEMRPEKCLSTGSLRSGIASILNSPNHTERTNTPTYSIIHNKVAPASVTIVDDRTATPTKKTSSDVITPIPTKTLKDTTLDFDIADFAVTGVTDIREDFNRQTLAAAKSGSTLFKLGKNKVSPCVTAREVEIREMQGNVMTCQAEVHRCPSSADDERHVDSDGIPGMVSLGELNGAFVEDTDETKC